MRKLLLSLVCMAFMAGIVIAETYTIVSYKDKVLTVTDKNGKELTGKVTDDTKVTIIDKNGDKKEGKIEQIEKRWGSPKSVGKKADLTIKDGKITEVTVKAGKKKKE